MQKDLYNIEEILSNPELMEVGRLAVEDTLVELRDDRIQIMRNNGLCIREYDGSPSSIVRLGIEHAVAIAMRAIVKELNNV